MVKAIYYAWMILLKCTVLVHSTDFDSLDFEVTDELEMMYADINPDNFYSDYFGILDSLSRDDWQNDARSAQQSVLQEEHALESSCALDVPALSNAVNTMAIDEGSFSSDSVSASLSLPGTSTASAISSVQVQSPAGSAKRACDTAEKKDREQGTRKKQKTNTTATSTATVANSALMDETEVCMAIEEFGRYFGKDAKVSGYMPRGMPEFAEYLAQRGLASVHSREIVELCTASKQWLGRHVFWRMLMLFVDTLSLELTDLNQLEDKKTVVLRDRTSKQPLSEYRKKYIYYVIAKFRAAERMEMQCSLNVLEDRGTAGVLGVLRWLLHHVKIECVGITCDLTEAGMTSEVLGRQVEALTQEWRGSKVHIDSLSLHFNFAQYKDASVVVKEYPWITVLKMHFIGASRHSVDTRKQALEALLLHCPALEQLGVFGVRVSVEHIRAIAAMLPQLVLLEVSFLSLKKLVLGQKEEEESMQVFPGLKTLKLVKIYNYSDAGIVALVCLFPSLQSMQIPSRYVTTPLIDALSNLHLLRSLKTVNSLLSIETAVYLLEKLPTLECLSIGVKELDRTLAHGLSKHAGIHTLNLRGNYTPDFLSSLVQPSPLMSTLKVLCLWRNSGTSYRSNFSTKDISSKDTAMKKFGCAIKIIY
ncbi:hypothetical protein NECID01_0676 [Nematocida sp. AWRm77]|nr:hypothetical protein NECID01_0676 [Nematocida sp. AWRm77]